MKNLDYGQFSYQVFEKSYSKGQVIKAQFELTYRCNLHCRHCYTDCFNNSENLRKELSTHEIKDILQQMSEAGVLWLNFTGGEVFVRKDFFEIYEFAWDLGFIVTLYTNGTVFTPQILDRLQKRPPFYIDVSCHSVNAESFDWFTKVPGSFERFHEGMRLLADSGLEFRIKTKAMSWNSAELESVKKYVESFGKKFTFTHQLAPDLKGRIEPLRLRISLKELKGLYDIYEDSEIEESVCQESRGLIQKPENDSLFRCSCATNMVHINAYGELGTCTHVYEARTSLRMMTFEEAVKDVFQRIREMRYESETVCKTCELHTFCRKNPTNARVESGSSENPVEADCDAAWLTAKRLTQLEIEHPLAKV